MTFEKITNASECPCLDGAVQDTVSVFARALNKDAVTENDFVSKWEKPVLYIDGKLADKSQLSDCEVICGLKGISVSKIENASVKSEVVKIYSQQFKISPKYKKGVLIFTFKDDAGVVKPTPDDKNKYHHDFYKADDFSLLFISASETIILSPPTSV